MLNGNDLEAEFPTGLPIDDEGLTPIEAAPEALPDAFPIATHEVQDEPAPADSVQVPPIRSLLGIDGVISRLDDLTTALDEHARIAAERERVIDRLHSENQNLRAGELVQAMLPLLRDLIRLHDDMAKTANAFDGDPNLSASAVLADFKCFRDVILDILFRHGVDSFDAVPGDVFDTKEHRAIGAVTTTDPALERTIANVLRIGFRRDNKVVRSAEVEVYRLQPNS